MESHFLKWMDAQKLQCSVKCSRQAQLFVDDGHRQVNGHGDPDLRLHRVGARSVVVLDSQMPLDPAKEQFDAPAQTIYPGDILITFCYPLRPSTGHPCGIILIMISRWLLILLTHRIQNIR